MYNNKNCVWYTDIINQSKKSAKNTPLYVSFGSNHGFPTDICFIPRITFCNVSGASKIEVGYIPEDRTLIISPNSIGLIRNSSRTSSRAIFSLHKFLSRIGEDSTLMGRYEAEVIDNDIFVFLDKPLHEDEQSKNPRAQQAMNKFSNKL